MTPTWLEIAVAILLLWIAWRIALLVTPLILKRIRDRRTASSRQSTNPAPDDALVPLQDRRDEKP